MIPPTATGRPRPRRHKAIRRREDVRWELVYAQPSPETRRIREEVAGILHRFGACHQFFRRDGSSSHTEW